MFTLNRGQLFPEKMLFMDYRFDGNENWWPWLKSDDFSAPVDSPLSVAMVPTKETSIATHWLHETVTAGVGIVLMGDRGTGKTKIIRNFLNNLPKEKYLHNTVNLSANMRAQQLQETIMLKLDRRRKGVFGPPVGKSVSEVDLAS